MAKEAGTRTSRAAASSAGGKKAKKDPNAPKRPLTAYMFFANEQREDVRKENPDAKFGDIGKLIGEKWRALDEEGKKKYEAKAATDKERYEKEKAAYTKKEE